MGFVLYIHYTIHSHKHMLCTHRIDYCQFKTLNISIAREDICNALALFNSCGNHACKTIIIITCKSTFEPSQVCQAFENMVVYAYNSFIKWVQKII